MIIKKSYYIICLRGTTREYFFHNYPSIPRENSLSNGNILENKNLMKLLTDEIIIKIFVCNIDQIVLFKTLNGFTNIIPLSRAYITLYMRHCSHYEMMEKKQHLSYGFL